MKGFNIVLLLLTIFSSCIFTGKENSEVDMEGINITRSDILYQKGDSITIDTLIGDFRIYYKIKETIRANKFSIEGNNENLVNEVLDKNILLNIQKSDTTNVISNKVICAKDFISILSNECSVDNYVIKCFYLKEVIDKKVTFSVELCENIHENSIHIDLEITEFGKISYCLIEK